MKFNDLIYNEMKFVDLSESDISFKTVKNISQILNYGKYDSDIIKTIFTQIPIIEILKFKFDSFIDFKNKTKTNIHKKDFNIFKTFYDMLNEKINIYDGKDSCYFIHKKRLYEVYIIKKELIFKVSTGKISEYSCLDDLLGELNVFSRPDTDISEIMPKIIKTAYFLAEKNNINSFKFNGIKEESRITDKKGKTSRDRLYEYILKKLNIKYEIKYDRHNCIYYWVTL